jgi:diguanylate cyclase (GGDEF)-like protein
MRDPRLAEMEFLSLLDQPVKLSFNQNGIPPGESKLGLLGDQFKHMVAQLIMDGYLTYHSTWLNPSADNHVSRFEKVQNGLIREFLNNNNMSLELTHKGRRRLWQLKEELQSNGKLDPFGIIIAQDHWERDLEIEFMFMEADKPLSLMLCDVDHFKAVNETCGYASGDDALKRFFRIVKDTVGDLGTVYRRGGDEVIVILRSVDIDRTVKLAEEIRRKTETDFKEAAEVKTCPTKPTASIGVATFESKTQAKEAVNSVDALVKRAKHEFGKNCVVSPSGRVSPPLTA